LCSQRAAQSVSSSKQSKATSQKSSTPKPNLRRATSSTSSSNKKASGNKSPSADYGNPSTAISDVNAMTFDFASVAKALNQAISTASPQYFPSLAFPSL
jgi:hypothetical protein